VAAARALEVGQSYALNQQQKEAQGTASDALKQLDSRLGSINDILVYVRERAIQAGNAALNQSDRQAIATDVSAQFDELMSQANTVDANSEYLFSGYRGDIQPFTGSLAGVTYQGDQGVRSLQVSNSRQIPTSVSGDELFMQIDDGAGGRTGIPDHVGDGIRRLVEEGRDLRPGPPPPPTPKTAAACCRVSSASP